MEVTIMSGKNQSMRSYYIYKKSVSVGVYVQHRSNQGSLFVHRGIRLINEEENQVQFQQFAVTV